MKMAILPSLLIYAVLFAACGPYEGPVLNSSDPKRFVPCQKPAQDDRERLSFDALTAVLKQNNWFIAAQNLETRIIDARKCKPSRRDKGHPMQREQDECLDVRFTISSSGAVTVINPPERRFYWKIEPRVRNWMEKLEVDYSEVRCYDTQQLAFWRQSAH
ncbi:MAG: hypothetical protein JXR76_22315 [Deltaproteobacteria bacterium]|nr:hypothetical protein [Deltaproteobacteria bacterium]